MGAEADDGIYIQSSQKRDLPKKSLELLKIVGFFIAHFQTFLCLYVLCILATMVVFFELNVFTYYLNDTHDMVIVVTGQKNQNTDLPGKVWRVLTSLCVSGLERETQESSG